MHPLNSVLKLIVFLCAVFIPEFPFLFQAEKEEKCCGCEDGLEDLKVL
jgi:hypothetical protein